MGSRRIFTLIQIGQPTLIVRCNTVKAPACRSRFVSTSAAPTQQLEADTAHNPSNLPVGPSERIFKRISTSVLLRSIILGQVFKSPVLFKPSLWLLTRIANSDSAFLNPDSNPFIRALILPLIYRQFCAGRDAVEIKQTVADVKEVGYPGVILCWAGEIVASKDGEGGYDGINKSLDSETSRRDIQAWRDSQLATLEAVGEGDIIGIKYTGAGPSISNALKQGHPPSPAMIEALDTICTLAAAQKKQIWFDAEYQVYHPTIDTWTLDLMRRYNSDNHALVLTTIQAYLKSSRRTVEEYLRHSQREGWTLGIKLVRGAYIASDVRERIHDTKEHTDASYDGIAHDLISKTWPGFGPAKDFPKVDVFLAGHNTISIRKAATLVKQLAEKGAIDERVGFGQLQGMADDVGCELLAIEEQSRQACADIESEAVITEEHKRRIMLGAPKAYKCLVWGSVKECLHYLVRRAVENRGAADRLTIGLQEMKKELWRRILRV